MKEEWNSLLVCLVLICIQQYGLISTCIDFVIISFMVKIKNIHTIDIFFCSEEKKGKYAIMFLHNYIRDFHSDNPHMLKQKHMTPSWPFWWPRTTVFAILHVIYFYDWSSGSHLVSKWIMQHQIRFRGILMSFQYWKFCWIW